MITALQQLISAHHTAEDFEMDPVFIDETEAAAFGNAGRTVKATGKKFRAPSRCGLPSKKGIITKFLMLEDAPQIEKAFIQEF